jgi:arsenate reductase
MTYRAGIITGIICTLVVVVIAWWLLTADPNVHPLAIQVMAEIGIDISQHRSKHLNEFLLQPIETVITVCGNADQACPMFQGQVNRHHWGFEDPAKAQGNAEQLLAVFRAVRDEMRRVFEAYAAGRRDAPGRSVRSSGL